VISTKIKRNHVLKFLYMLLAVTAVTLPIDQYSKIFAKENYLIHEDEVDTRIYQGKRDEVVAIGSGDINLLVQLTYVRNHGASYGVMNALPERLRIPLLVSIAIAFYTGIFIGGAVAMAHKKANLAWTLAGVLGGALGNLVDRIGDGYVTDLIAIKGRLGGSSFWVLPIFNVADIIIVISLFLFLAQIILEPKYSVPK
jgi:lipoprotein signal peptidase